MRFCTRVNSQNKRCSLLFLSFSNSLYWSFFLVRTIPRSSSCNSVSFLMPKAICFVEASFLFPRLMGPVNSLSNSLKSPSLPGWTTYAMQVKWVSCVAITSFCFSSNTHARSLSHLAQRPNLLHFVLERRPGQSNDGSPVRHAQALDCDVLFCFWIFVLVILVNDN